MFSGFGLARLTIDIEAVEDLFLPRFKGSTLRGGFGYAFKKTVCALKTRTCDSCLLKEKCVYSYVFETPPPSDSAIMRKYPKVPHPFVLEPPDEDRNVYHAGERITFGLVLIGKAIDYLPYFIYSFDVLGEMGIGKGKGKFFLKEVKCLLPKAIRQDEVESAEPSVVVYDGHSKVLKTAPFSLTWEDIDPGYPFPDNMTLEFRTPTRLRFDGRYTSEPEFHILIRGLLRRISTLSYFHCGKLMEMDFRSLISQAREVLTDGRSLRWFDWERYSSRQDTKMKMGGFIGSATFRGDMRPFWPLLVLGQAVHVGKGTSFGLGRYEIMQS